MIHTQACAPHPRWPHALPCPLFSKCAQRTAVALRIQIEKRERPGGSGKTDRFGRHGCAPGGGLTEAQPFIGSKKEHSVFNYGTAKGSAQIDDTIRRDAKAVS